MRKSTATFTALVLAAALAGCSSSGGEAAPETEQSSPSGPVVAGEATPDSFVGSQFSYVGFGGSSQVPHDENLQAFADVVGAVYAPDGPPDMAKLEAQVNSGNVSWDLVAISDIIANDPEKCGTLFEKIDYSKIDTSFLSDLTPTTECGVPDNANGWSFAYNTEEFDANPSWEDFFDTEKFPGKRAIYAGIPELQLEIALLADGVAEADLYPLDVDRALAKFDTIRDDLIFYTTGSESQQMMESDQIVGCICWSGRTFTIVDAGHPWSLSENASPQVRLDYVGIPKGSKNVDLAHAALNWLLGADQQEKRALATGYPSLNSSVSIPKEGAYATVDILDPRFKAHVVDMSYWVPNNDEVTDRWTTWIAG